MELNEGKKGFIGLKLLKAAFRNFPAASRAAMISVSMTLIMVLAARFVLKDDRPAVFLLGDSCIGNYRLDPGTRLQDIMEKQNPHIRVENWAEPGAAPLDFYLQMTHGRLLAGHPKAVVVALEPSKFLDQGKDHRLDDGGRNLRWIPWNRYGLDLFFRLTPKERNIALVQQASVPFYAIADFARSAWTKYIQWPWERNQMRTASPERRKKIEAKSIEQGRIQEAAPLVDYLTYANLPRAKDAAFLLQSLQDEGIETRVLILPFGNPDLIERTFPLVAKAKHDSIDILMKHWLKDLGVAYIDFNQSEEIKHFPDSTWDDLSHLKSPSAFVYMSKKILDSELDLYGDTNNEADADSTFFSSLFETSSTN